MKMIIIKPIFLHKKDNKKRGAFIQKLHYAMV